MPGTEEAFEHCLVQWATSAIHSGPPVGTKEFVFETWIRRFLNGSSGESQISRLLSVARLLAADERELFDCVGRVFVDCWGAVCGVSLWNEQLAVRSARSFLSSQCQNAAFATRPLMSELASYAASRIAPVPPFPEVPELRSRTLEQVSEHLLVVAPSGEASTAEGRLVLCKPIPAFSPIVTISLSHVFVIQNVTSACPLGKELHTHWRESVPDDETILLLSFLFQNLVLDADASPWREVFRHVPKLFPTVPTFWSQSEMGELEGLSIQDEVAEKLSRLAAFHTDVKQLLRLVLPRIHCIQPACIEDILDRAFSLDSLHWARAVMDSRAIILNIDGEATIALVPVVDMVNHNVGTDVLRPRVELFGTNASVKISDGKAVEVPDGTVTLYTAAELREDRVGREIFMTYGPLANWELLLSYGFVLDVNENDRLPFPLEIGCDEVNEDSYEASRRSIRDAFHLCSPSQGMWIPYSGIPPPVLLAHLRLLHAEESDFPSLATNPFAVRSLMLEVTVIKTIKLVINEVLGSFPTTMAEDEAQLTKCTEKYSSRRNCIVLRAGIKRIAMRSLEWCEARLRQLQCTN